MQIVKGKNACFFVSVTGGKIFSRKNRKTLENQGKYEHFMKFYGSFQN